MTHDAWMIAITGVGGATLLLMCIGRKRLREIRDRIGMQFYRWMVISPAHVNTDDCPCDSCDPFAGHVASLPEGITTPADRYSFDEYLTRGSDRLKADLTAKEIELSQARVDLQNAEALLDMGHLDPVMAADFAALAEIFRSPTTASDSDRPH